MTQETDIQKIDIGWLEEKAEHAKGTNNSLFDATQKLKNIIIKKVIEKLKEEKWSIIDFVTLVTGFYLIEKLEEDKYIKIMGDSHGALAKRQLSLTWIKIVKDKAKKFYDKYLAKFKGFIQNKEIKESALPVEWLILSEKRNVRYPCYTNGQSGGSKSLIPQKFKILILCSYYDLSISDQELEKIESSSDIVMSTLNFNKGFPSIISYEQLKERWKDKPKNQIQLLCLQNCLNAYIEIPEELVVTDFTVGCPSSDCYQKKHENPFYKKRYVGLEKLKNGDDPYKFDLKTLFYNEKLSVNEPYLLGLRGLDATDLETKFHIHRKIKRGSYKNVIELSDLVFLEEEIRLIEENYPAGYFEPTQTVFDETFAANKDDIFIQYINFIFHSGKLKSKIYRLRCVYAFLFYIRFRYKERNAFPDDLFQELSFALQRESVPEDLLNKLKQYDSPFFDEFYKAAETALSQNILQRLDQNGENINSILFDSKNIFAWLLKAKLLPLEHENLLLFKNFEHVLKIDNVLEPPKLLNLTNLVELLEEKNEENAIQTCLNSSFGVYLKSKQEVQILWETSIDTTSLSDSNYQTRYQGLERLPKVSQIPTRQDQTVKYLWMNREIGSNKPVCVFFEPTQSEQKLGIVRNILLPVGGKIGRHDLWFVEEEVTRFLNETLKRRSQNNVSKIKSRDSSKNGILPIYAVFKRAYVALEEAKKNIGKKGKLPSANEVEKEIKSNYQIYDTEEIIETVSKEKITWINEANNKRVFKFTKNFDDIISRIRRGIL